MELTQERPGYYWHSTDLATIRMNEAGPTAPTHLECSIIGSTGIVRPKSVRVALADLKLLGTGLFGEARGKKGGGAGWTGDSHKFGIYQTAETYFERYAVIIVNHGGGTEAFIDESLDAGEYWASICHLLPTERLWDICRSLTGTYRKGYEEGQDYVLTAFMEDRLKKRRRRGHVYSEFVPKTAKIA